jgi:hypothetical protein
MIRLYLILVLFFSSFRNGSSDCSILNNCNGHGACQSATSTCNCFEGWGSDSDIRYLFYLNNHLMYWKNNEIAPFLLVSTKLPIVRNEFVRRVELGRIFPPAKPQLTPSWSAPIEVSVTEPMDCVSVLMVSLERLARERNVRTIVPVTVLVIISNKWQE